MHFSLADQLLDLVNNAATAKAATIRVRWAERDGALDIEVADDGSGMSEETRQRALSPFYTDGVAHPTRKVGLGLPFLVQTADSVGGEFRLDSEPGRGTVVGVRLPVDHVDLPAHGDLSECFAYALAVTGPREMVIDRVRFDDGYTLRRSELEDALGDLEDPESLRLLIAYIRSQEEAVWQK